MLPSQFKDVFESGGIIVHPTNIMGSWDAGFALKLRHYAPRTYRAYHGHCQGDRLLIIRTGLLFEMPDEPRILCLYIQRSTLASVDGKDSLASNYHAAMQDALPQIPLDSTMYLYDDLSKSYLHRADLFIKNIS